MWLFARCEDKPAFLSVVVHRDDPSKLLVRGRKKEHLENAFPNVPIEDDGEADYRWRMVVSRVEVTDYMVRAVAQIDYDSHVKETISGDDDAMYNAMLDTWTALYALQDPSRGRWGRGRYWDPELAAAVTPATDDEWDQEWAKITADSAEAAAEHGDYDPEFRAEDLGMPDWEPASFDAGGSFSFDSMVGQAEDDARITSWLAGVADRLDEQGRQR